MNLLVRHLFLNVLKCINSCQFYGCVVLFFSFCFCYLSSCIFNNVLLTVVTINVSVLLPFLARLLLKSRF